MSTTHESVGYVGPVEVPVPAYPMSAPPLVVDLELRYEVAAGRVCITIDGLPRTCRAGEILIVPGGVAHRIEAEEGEPPRLLRHVPDPADDLGTEPPNRTTRGASR